MRYRSSSLRPSDYRCQTDRQTDYAKKKFTDLGMSTPGRHLISSSPKNSVPRMYCNGSPPALRDTRSERILFSTVPLRRLAASWLACSFIHRSSLRADTGSRQTGSSLATCGSFGRACRISEGDKRGMRHAVKWPERGRRWTCSPRGNKAAMRCPTSAQFKVCQGPCRVMLLLSHATFELPVRQQKPPRYSP